MLTIQELEALRGLVQINVNINLPKGHHPMAYDQVRIPLSWKPTSVTTVAFAALANFLITVPDAVTDLYLESGSNMGGFSFTPETAGSALVSFSSKELVSCSYGDALLKNFPLLTSVQLPLLATVVGTLSFSNNPSLTSIPLPALTVLGGDFNADGCALTESEVDAKLAMLVAATSDGATPWGTGAQTCNLDGGTNAVPSAAGLVSKGTLEGRGATVNVNS